MEFGKAVSSNQRDKCNCSFRGRFVSSAQESVIEKCAGSGNTHALCFFYSPALLPTTDKSLVIKAGP